MFLGCDWLIRVQLIPNITQNSAKICNNSAKICNNVPKICNNSAKICNKLFERWDLLTEKPKIWRPNFHVCLKIRRNFNTIWDSSLTIMITKQTLKYAGTLYIKLLAMAFVNMIF